MPTVMVKGVARGKVSGNLREQLENVTLQEEELFRKRQKLVHHALQEEELGDLRERYLEIREQESGLRYEHLRLENLLQPGHFYHDPTEGMGTLSPRKKYWYLFLIVTSAAALLLLMIWT